MNTVQHSIGQLKRETHFEFAFRLRQSLSVPPKRCVLLLHGVGGNEMNLASLASEIAPDTLVVLPRGPLQFAENQFGWFRVAFTAAGPSIVLAEAEESRLGLIRFVEQIQSAYGIDPPNTVIAGFSQGGVLSASVALSAPERVGGFSILSGRILPELEPHLASTARLTQLRAFIGHGEYDSKLPVVWSQRAEQLLNELGVAHVTRRYPIDHGISDAMQVDFLAWLGK